VAWCGQQNVIVFSFTQRQFWKEHFIETNQLWSNSWLKEGQSRFLEPVERNLCVHTHNSKFKMKIYCRWFCLSMIFKTKLRNWYLKQNNFSYNSTNTVNAMFFLAAELAKEARNKVLSHWMGDLGTSQDVSFTLHHVIQFFFSCLKFIEVYQHLGSFFLFLTPILLSLWCW